MRMKLNVRTIGRNWRKLAIVAVLAGLATSVILWGQHGSVNEAVAAPPQQQVARAKAEIPASENIPFLSPVSTESARKSR